MARSLSLKKVRTSSPTELSLQYLRALGWYCEVTENNLRLRRSEKRKLLDATDEDITFKRDLLGFADLLCLKPGRRLLVQVTSITNVAARVSKVRSLVTFEHAKQAGFEIQVHGWGATMKDGVRIIDLTNVVTDWSTLFKQPKRGKRQPRVQRSLL